MYAHAAFRSNRAVTALVSMIPWYIALLLQLCTLTMLVYCLLVEMHTSRGKDFRTVLCCYIDQSLSIGTISSFQTGLIPRLLPIFLHRDKPWVWSYWRLVDVIVNHCSFITVFGLRYWLLRVLDLTKYCLLLEVGYIDNCSIPVSWYSIMWEHPDTVKCTEQKLCIFLQNVSTLPPYS